MVRYVAKWCNMVHHLALFPVYDNWATNINIRQQFGNKYSLKKETERQVKTYKTLKNK
jgi:hypothetical protein